MHKQIVEISNDDVQLSEWLQRDAINIELKFKVNRIDIEYICQLSRRLCMLGMKLIEYERLESTSEKRKYFKGDFQKKDC